MAPRRPSANGGFTFLGLLFLIAILAVMATAASVTFRFASQRDREAQLLWVGKAYREALAGYAKAHQGQGQPYPTTLAQLLLDPQKQTTVRYLRRPYFDPMTGSDDWGLVKNAQGGITGVFSQSADHPIRGVKVEGVPEDAGDAQTYADWVFSPIKHQPKTTAPPPPPADEDDGSRAYHPQPLPPVVPDTNGN